MTEQDNFKQHVIEALQYANNIAMNTNSADIDRIYWQGKITAFEQVLGIIEQVYRDTDSSKDS